MRKPLNHQHLKPGLSKNPRTNRPGKPRSNNHNLPKHHHHPLKKRIISKHFTIHSPTHLKKTIRIFNKYQTNIKQLKK
jgi:hypothetical protein